MYLGAIFVVLVCSSVLKLSEGQETFTNPIFEGNSPDPAVFHLDDHYYLPLSTDQEHALTMHKSPVMTDFRNSEKKVIFRTPGDYKDLWASELHEVDGELYIYFTMQGGGEGHRMYVMRAKDPKDPLGDWDEPIKMMPDYWEGAIDGTLLRHTDGRLYMVWSSIACLWIAPMENATSMGHSFVKLRCATAQWECLGMDGRTLCMSEGPYVIYNKDVSYLIFSASETFSPHYCLGMMSIDSHKDPMTLSNWWYGPDEPVFMRNDEEDVYCTGHAAFTTSPDWTETWMIYHGTDSPTVIGGNRVARAEKIEWGEDGRPIFPKAHGYNHPQPVPSGQV